MKTRHISLSLVAAALALSATITMFAQTQAPSGAAQAPSGWRRPDTSGRRPDASGRRPDAPWRSWRRRPWRVTPAKGPGYRARYPVRSGAQLHEVAAQRVYGRRHRCRHQLQGAYLRQHLRPANAQFRIRSERQLRAGDREGLLRLRVLSWHTRRCPGQHLGDRRGREHRSSSSTPKAA